ncbi:MAG: hypothetical protein IJE06_03030 [Alistipes sp.]|nr:hypothetical protein [Alistipes sp.]
MVQIIIAIVAVVALYFLIKKYSKIDATFFDNGSVDFVPMGRVAVYASVCLGAVLGFVVAIYSMFNTDFPFELGFRSWGIVCNIVPYLLFVTIATCFYTAFAHEVSWGRRFARSFFMLFACILGFIGGIVGSVLVLVVLFLWFLLKFIFAMVFGKSSSGSSTSSSSGDDYDYLATDQYGFERKLKSNGFGGFTDDKGDRWKKVGDEFIPDKDF